MRARPLPFALPYPGGTTTSLQVVSSGYISPAGANPIQLLPSVSALMNGQPRWAVLWSFVNPTPNGANNVYVDSNPEGPFVHHIPVNESGEFTEPWPNGFFGERLAELVD